MRSSPAGRFTVDGLIPGSRYRAYTGRAAERVAGGEAGRKTVIKRGKGTRDSRGGWWGKEERGKERKMGQGIHRLAKVRGGRRGWRKGRS